MDVFCYQRYYYYYYFNYSGYETSIQCKSTKVDKKGCNKTIKVYNE